MDLAKKMIAPEKDEATVEVVRLKNGMDRLFVRIRMTFGRWRIWGI